MVGSDTSQVSLVLKADKSGGKEAKGEIRKKKRGMRALESIGGGQKNRDGKLQMGVTPTEQICDAWGKDMKTNLGVWGHP